MVSCRQGAFINYLLPAVVAFLACCYGSQSLADDDSKVLNSKLIFYMAKGNESKVRELLNEGANPNARIVLDDGRLSGNILSHRLGLDSTKILEILLSHGADPNVSTVGSASPLGRAAAKYRVCVQHEAKRGKQFLRNYCGDLNAQHYRQVILLLLKYGADPNFIGERPKPTLQVPFIEVVKSGDLDLVKKMVSSGADINQRDRYGHAAAAVSNNREITSLLLDLGADVTLLTNKGETQTEYAIVRYASPTLINVLVDKDMFRNVNKYSVVFSAVRWGDHELLKKLIALGASVNMRANHLGGRTPLIEAIFKQDLEAIHILLQNGASPFAREFHNDIGRTPLEIAKWKSTPAIVSLIESYINKIKP